MIELQLQRHKELVSYLEEIQAAARFRLSINELADVTHLWLKKTLIGSGKTVELFTEEILLDLGSSLEEAELFRGTLIKKLFEDESLHTNQVYDQVYKVECQKKINTIANLTRFQRMMYELRFFNSKLAKRGLKKLNENEASKMKKVLRYE